MTLEQQLWAEEGWGGDETVDGHFAGSSLAPLAFLM